MLSDLQELETLQVRLECQHLYSENMKLRQEFKELKGVSSQRRVLELQKEIEHLHWQLNKMEVKVLTRGFLDSIKILISFYLDSWIIPFIFIDHSI